MKKILILGTGGTISCSAKQKDGKSPIFSVENILQLIPTLEDAHIITDTPIKEEGKTIYIDSTNMQPEYMAQVAERIYRGYKEEGIDGAVVLGGTDTMEESGPDLTFSLPFKKIPVVLTGSMRPPDEKKSDAARNIKDAVRFATIGMPGTYIVFHRRVISACRAKKIHPTATDAFRSINFPQIGHFKGEEFIADKRAQEAITRYQETFRTKEMKLMNSLQLATHLLELYRGIKPSLIDYFFNNGYKGLIIEAFGTGGIPNLPKYRSLLPQIQKWGIERFIGITSKAFTGQATGEYKVSTEAFEAGATSLFDMLPLTALCKANWVFGQATVGDILTVKKLMFFPFEMEIDPKFVADDMKISLEEVDSLLV